MRHVADRFVVILDANVLYPFRMRDALLRFFAAGLFRARWTERIVAEWRENLLARKPDFADSVDAQIDAMRRHFDDAWVTGYEPLERALSLPDPNDRHVLAAAIRCGAQHIVTQNLSDFPPEALSAYDVEALSADDFLAATFELYPDRALDALAAMRRSYRRPAYTPAAFAADLAAKAMPKLASFAHQNLARI